MFSVNALALVISWVVAVTFTPYIGYHAAEGEAACGRRNRARRVRHAGIPKASARWSTGASSTARPPSPLTLAIFALGVFGFKFIEKQFFPDSSRPELMVEMWLPEGTSFAANEKQVKKFEAFIRKQEGVVSVTSYVGTGSPRFYLPLDQIFPQTNVSQIVVLPKDLHARERAARQDRRHLQEDFPEVRGRVKLLPNGPPVPYPVQFR
jgi:multidrug efflux pump